MIRVNVALTILRSHSDEDKVIFKVEDLINEQGRECRTVVIYFYVYMHKSI